MLVFADRTVVPLAISHWRFLAATNRQVFQTVVLATRKATHPHRGWVARSNFATKPSAQAGSAVTEVKNPPYLLRDAHDCIGVYDQFRTTKDARKQAN